MQIKRISTAGLILSLSATMAFAASGKRYTNATFTNPASLSMTSGYDTNAALLDTTQDQKLSVSLFAQSSSYTFTGRTVTPGMTPIHGSVSEKKVSYIPEALYVHRLNRRWVVGFKIGRPYWMNVGYPADSDLSPALTFPIQRTVDVLDFSPEASYDLNSWLTLAAGVDIADGSLVTTNTVYGSSSQIQNNSLSAWGVGYHLGALVKPWLGGFVGVSYFSSVKFDLKGTSDYTGFGPASTHSDEATSQLSTPDSIELNVFQALSRQFGLMAGVEYTHWSVLDSFTIHHAAPLPGSGATSATLIEPLGYTNTWKYSFGARYQALNNLVLTVGASYDDSPSVSDLKTPTSIEPENYWSVGVSASYEIDSRLSLKLAYGHSFLADHNVKNTAPTSFFNGKINVDANQLSGQLTATF